MTVHRVVPVLNVSDVRASLAWFAELGWETSFVWDPTGGAEEPGFAGTQTGAVEIFLCRDCQGERGAWMSWFLGSPAEVDELHARALGLGLEVSRPPADEVWGVREFHLRHPDGHIFRVGAFLD